MARFLVDRFGPVTDRLRPVRTDAVANSSATPIIYVALAFGARLPRLLPSRLGRRKPPWADLGWSVGRIYSSNGQTRNAGRKGALLHLGGRGRPRGIVLRVVAQRGPGTACRHLPCPCIACFGARFRRSRAGRARGLYGVVAYLVRSQHRERYTLRDLRSLLGTSPQVPDPVPLPVVLSIHLPPPIAGSAVPPTPCPGVPAATNAMLRPRLSGGPSQLASKSSGTERRFRATRPNDRSTRVVGVFISEPSGACCGLVAWSVPDA